MKLISEDLHFQNRKYIRFQFELQAGQDLCRQKWVQVETLHNLPPG